MSILNKIGQINIFNETADAAIRIGKVHDDHKLTPMLASGPQQGKTAVGIAVANRFYLNCMENNETYQILYIINMSDVSLRDQTMIRFWLAGLKGIVTICHHAELNKILPADVDKRCIILDECHQAQGKHRPLHEFFKRFGINYGKPVDSWPDKRNYLLDISATGYAHKVREMLDERMRNPSIQTVWLEKPEGYYGLTDMVKDDRQRLKQSLSLISGDKKEASIFLKNALNEFNNNCKSYGNGYLLIRATGKIFNIVNAWLKTRYVVTDYSDENKNIHFLDTHLSIRPNKPEIILIKNTLRAGKTLTTTKYIRGWIESANSNPDSIGQVIGRCCGQSKYEDIFPIYCDVSSVNDAADFYNREQNLIPKGNWNSKAYANKIYEWICVDNTEENKTKLIEQRVTDAVNRVSGWNEINVAKAILNGTKPSKYSTAFIIDGPNKNYQNDWNDLMSHYPEYIGKICYVINREESVKMENIAECKIRKDAIFSVAN